MVTMHSVLDDEMTGVNINDTSVSRCPCCLGSEAWLRDQILTNEIYKVEVFSGEFLEKLLLSLSSCFKHRRKAWRDSGHLSMHQEMNV